MIIMKSTVIPHRQLASTIMTVASTALLTTRVRVNIINIKAEDRKQCRVLLDVVVQESATAVL